MKSVTLGATPVFEITQCAGAPKQGLQETKNHKILAFQVLNLAKTLRVSPATLYTPAAPPTHSSTKTHTRTHQSCLSLSFLRKSSLATHATTSAFFFLESISRVGAPAGPQGLRKAPVEPLYLKSFLH